MRAVIIAPAVRLAALAAGLYLVPGLAAKSPLSHEPDPDLHLKPGALEIDPSFTACSYYFHSSGWGGGNLAVEFREKGAPQWRRGLSPVSDRPAGIWKGSVFGLQEDDAWELRLVAGSGNKVVAEGKFRTWSSHPPIAKVVDLSQLPGADRGEVVISDQGTPEGWIKYVAPPGWVMRHPDDPHDAGLAAITFQHASHVILEGVTVAGGRRYGILVDESESVRVLNCEVSGWGRVGVQQFTNTGTRGKYLDAAGELINLDGGIEVSRSARTVVERCYVHDPRGRANSWMFSHPSGPEAMHINFARGGTVLRWNDFVGSDEHRWNDVIESSANSSPTGGFYRDSDITGNYLAFGEDDGIELEGGGMNVRFYGNKVEGTTCGVSTGADVLGPQYVIGNLVANPGDESGLTLYFFKNSYPEPNDGRRYFVNNTLYGFTGTAYGSYGGAKDPVRRGFMRNNVFLCGNSRPPEAWAEPEDFDHDLFWVKGSPDASRKFVGTFRAVGQESHGVAEDPHLIDPAGGDYRLAPNSPARGQAVAVTDVVAAGADLGAFAEFSELPFRPLALIAAPRQIKFAASERAERREVRLTLAASARQAVAFRIRQNTAFDWFRVEPAAGEIKPGETLKLAVTAEAARLSGRRLFKGAFLVRTPDGLSRPISVYADGDFQEDLHPAAAPDAAYLEAASAPGVQKYVRATKAPGAFGGHYVALEGPTQRPALEFEFDLPRAGEYSLVGRAAVEDDVMQKHEFNLKLDGASAERIELTADYQWNAAVEPQRFRAVYLRALGKLSAGKHRIRFSPVRGGLDLNELIVTDNPAVYFDEYWQRPRP